VAQTSVGFYEVAFGQRAVYLRVHGLASMNNCLCVRNFIEEALRAGQSFLVVDLAECSSMDSTFLGVLAGAATFERKGEPVSVAVVNANEECLKEIEGVGLQELILVEPKPFAVPPLEFARLDEQPSEERRLAMIRDAHRKLVSLSEKNEKLFGPIVVLLEEDMKRRGMKSG